MPVCPECRSEIDEASDFCAELRPRCDEPSRSRRPAGPVSGHRRDRGRRRDRSGRGPLRYPGGGRLLRRLPAERGEVPPRGRPGGPARASTRQVAPAQGRAKGRDRSDRRRRRPAGRIVPRAAHPRRREREEEAARTGVAAETVGKCRRAGAAHSARAAETGEAADPRFFQGGLFHRFLEGGLYERPAGPADRRAIRQVPGRIVASARVFRSSSRVLPATWSTCR